MTDWSEGILSAKVALEAAESALLNGNKTEAIRRLMDTMAYVDKTRRFLAKGAKP